MTVVVLIAGGICLAYGLAQLSGVVSRKNALTNDNFYDRLESARYALGAGIALTALGIIQVI